MSGETINFLVPVQETVELPRDFVQRFNRAVWYTGTRTRPFYGAQPHEVLGLGNGLQRWDKSYNGRDMLGVRLVELDSQMVFAAIHTDYPDTDSRHGITKLELFEIGAPLRLNALFHEMAGKKLEWAELPRLRNDSAAVDPDIKSLSTEHTPLLTPVSIMRILENFWPAINSETFHTYGMRKN